MPLVSVVMPVFNGERFLAEAIESILTQTFSDFELIIVDDGSTDGSAKIIQAYAERDCRIRFLTFEENRGMADARNHAIVNASGAYIAGMDCDDVSLPERLQKQVDFLRSNPEIGALGACFQRVKHDLTPLNDFQVPLQHCLIVLNMFIGGGFILHSTLIVRREFLKAVGGYESGRRTHDDRELHTRLLPETRIRYANLPDILMLYRRHERAMGFGKDHQQLAQKYEEQIGRMLERLWNEAPKATLVRFSSMYLGLKLSWADRRLARRDITRLIASMADAKWVDPEDRQLLLAEMNRRLERTTPRLWQMFCHWYRYRIRRHLVSRHILLVLSMTCS